MEEEPRKSRRTASACTACRQSKIKCSGDDPCQNCQRRSVRCQFTEAGNKVMVSEKYLRALRKEVLEHRSSKSRSDSESRQSTSPQHISPEHISPHHTSPIETQTPRTRRSQTFSTTRSGSNAGNGVLRGIERSSMTSFGLSNDTSADRVNDITLVSPAPTIEASQQQESIADAANVPTYHPIGSPLGVLSTLTPTPSQVIQNVARNKRTWIWLAPWSPWSFTFRLMLMLKDRLHPGTPPLPQSLFDPDVYDITWTASSETDFPDFSGLPSQDYAIYLFNTVKFHLGQTFRLWDDEGFEKEIRSFYSDAFSKTIDSRLWFVKFLLILAFGTAFLSPPTSLHEPPGGKYFCRAMSLMPETSYLWKDSLLAIEVLALTALFLFSIDYKESAYLQLVQAIRIAQLEGLHTHMPEDKLGPEITACCRDIWWTLYIMDRHFSLAVGLPMSVQDSDISVPLNPLSGGTNGDSQRSLQVNLSHLTSVILSTLYKNTTTPLPVFLEQTRSILHTLAHHAQEIERIMCVKYQNCVGSIPRPTRYMTMQYHQCVILATRPLILSIMKQRLDCLGHPGDEKWDSFLEQTAAIIVTGIKSAAKTLHLLTTEGSLLEQFLPYDVEFCFGAALHLTMASALFPAIADYQTSRQMAEQTFMTLITRGNRVALARRAEWLHVEGLCLDLMTKIQQQGHETLTVAFPDLFQANTGRKPQEDLDKSVSGESHLSGLTLPTDAEHASLPCLPPHITSNMEFLDTIGISSEEFLGIVEQMGNPDSLPESMLTLGQLQEDNRM